MQSCCIKRMALVLGVALAGVAPDAVLAEGDLHKVKHIIIVMQENRSLR